jgi:exopolyphosphatase/pppGpp-phosphohydrolase
MRNIENESPLFKALQSCGLRGWQSRKIRPFVELMKACDPDPAHPIHVAWLASRLFDQLKGLHGLGGQERFLLNAASLCHDIGWSQRVKKHNKGSRDLILRENLKTLSTRQQIIIALVARYHRGKIPESKHRYYTDLAADDKQVVNKLSAILRIADGLDRTHASVVDDITVCLNGKRVIIHILTRRDSSPERYAVVKKKKNLFELVFNKSLVIKETIIR